MLLGCIYPVIAYIILTIRHKKISLLSIPILIFMWIFLYYILSFVFAIILPLKLTFIFISLIGSSGFFEIIRKYSDFYLSRTQQNIQMLTLMCLSSIPIFLFPFNFGGVMGEQLSVPSKTTLLYGVIIWQLIMTLVLIFTKNKPEEQSSSQASSITANPSL